jgi:hypothetical protein
VEDFLPAGHESADKDYHQGWYLSSVYQFSPRWSAGLRYGELDAWAFHEEEEAFEQQDLSESELSISWHNSHFSKVRLELSHQSSDGFDDAADGSAISLQYVMTMGAHSAHQF